MNLVDSRPETSGLPVEQPGPEPTRMNLVDSRPETSGLWVAGRDRVASCVSRLTVAVCESALFALAAFSHRADASWSPWWLWSVVLVAQA